MPEQLFDRTAEYESMLNQGIGLSGESQDFFIAGRIDDMRSQLPADPRRILDFGCGIGRSCAFLSRVFPGAEIIGAELVEGAIRHARAHFSSARVSFVNVADLRHLAPFDLCYVNGVFHHIPPSERQQALEIIRAAMSPGAYLALFENNPWNPGTRMVMNRIPFDRDAIRLSCVEATRRVRAAGFRVIGSRFLFYFPKFLSAFRFIEPLLVRIPLGAQYYVLASVPPLARESADPN